MNIVSDILIDIIDYATIYEIINLYRSNMEINNIIDTYIWKKLLKRDYEQYIDDEYMEEMEKRIRNNKIYNDKQRYINLYLRDKIMNYDHEIFHYMDDVTKELNF